MLWIGQSSAVGEIPKKKGTEGCVREIVRKLRGKVRVETEGGYISHRLLRYPQEEGQASVASTLLLSAASPVVAKRRARRV